MKWRFIVAVLAVGFAVSLAAPSEAQQRATRPQVTRPEGPVWDVIRKNCTTCHGIDDYAFYAMDRAKWNEFIESKHQTGAGAGATARLSAGDRNLLLDWVVAEFGPDKKPFPRAFVPPEITEFLSDPEANRIIGAQCAGCHAIDRVNDARNSAQRWRVILVQMRERGAKLEDQELEALVEWLARVKGTNENQ